MKKILKFLGAFLVLFIIYGLVSDYNNNWDAQPIKQTIEDGVIGISGIRGNKNSYNIFHPHLKIEKNKDLVILSFHGISKVQVSTTIEEGKKLSDFLIEYDNLRELAQKEKIELEREIGSISVFTEDGESKDIKFTFWSSWTDNHIFRRIRTGLKMDLYFRVDPKSDNSNFFNLLHDGIPKIKSLLDQIKIEEGSKVVFNQNSNKALEVIPRCSASRLTSA